MNQVQVDSIAALRRFQAALREYAEAVQDVFGTLSLETQRTVDWVDHDRLSFWPAEARRATDQLAESLNALERKQVTVDRSDPPSCTEEKMAVAAARQRLRDTEAKVAAARRWSPLVKHQADEYRGVLAKLAHLVDTDLPQAIATLERMATALEKYSQTSLGSKESP